MSRVYSQLYFHIVWSTRKRGDLISETTKRLLEKSIQAKCRELGCVLHAIGIAEDHVHILVTIPPNIRISDFVRDVKGSSSHLINHTTEGESPLYWQQGYGILTISNHDRPRVVEYINSQWEKHRSGNVLPSLEKTGLDSTLLQQDL